MATRKEKVFFAVKRFRGFWNQFKRSKRGLTGVLIVVFFTALALIAPLITYYDPLIPKEGEGTYPGAGGGRKIAEMLCVPAWYKYVPWVTRGPTLLQERFYSSIQTYLGMQWQLFGAEGETNATSTVLRLTRRVSEIKNITADFPNGTSRTLPQGEWSQVPTRPREIQFVTNVFYDNGTIFTVDYMTGNDIVENMQIIPGYTFSTEDTINAFTSQTNRPDITTVKYNSEKGYTTRQLTNSGCMEIAYRPNGIPNETVTVTLSVPFEYPYYEPPRSFFIHFSSFLEGVPTNITVNFLFTKTTPTETEFLLSDKFVSVSTSYQHLSILSIESEVLQKIGVNPVVDKIFPAPANYTADIRIEIPASSHNLTLYLDNLDFVLYGNAFGILGTDNGGERGGPYPRDLFTALVYGTRVSLFIGVVSAVLSTLIGLFLGLVAGYVKGIVDEGIMRFADLLLVLPTLPLFIILIVALRQFGAVSMWNIIIIITFFGWMSFSRSVRSMVLSIRERAFIEAARAAGAGKLYIINRHILPNVFSLVYITLATAVPGAIVLEASLSWLGLGDPRVASWGKILYDFNTSGTAITKGLTEYWFWIFPACLCIALLAAAFILIGYALDEILNPRLRERR